MREVFWASHEFFALDDFLKWKNFYFESEPLDYHGAAGFRRERRHPIHAVKEVHERIVCQSDDRICDHFGTEFGAEIQHADVLALWEAIHRSASNVVAGTPCKIAAVIPAT